VSPFLTEGMAVGDAIELRGQLEATSPALPDFRRSVCQVLERGSGIVRRALEGIIS
jgi:hypothetical protein